MPKDTKQFETFDAVIAELSTRVESVAHEIVYYIEKPVTLDQWAALDQGMSEVFDRVLGEASVIGIAGPIPELGGAAEPEDEAPTMEEDLT